MTYNIPSHQNPNDTFWLARHAHNVLSPLIEAARQYEPSIFFSIELNFDVERTYRHAGSYLDIIAHWDRDGMFLHENSITTNAQVDAVAAKVQAFIDAEQAALEEAEDAKVQYELEQVDAAADRDWEFQMERAAERADIERADHDHDIELQNEMAGN